jgi:hypothetical protein
MHQNNSFSNQTKKIFFIAHTHWDREWYLTQRQFQYRLQWTVREIIESLEKDSNRKFTLDGQTVLLDDVLEWQPELKDRIRHLIKKNQLEIGPWYTMPDLWLAGHTALRKNLERGRSMCHQWGAAFPNFVYVPDSFGVPSAAVQLFKEFGFKAILFGRSQPPALGEKPVDFFWKSKDSQQQITALAIPGHYLNAVAIPPAHDEVRLREWFEGLVHSYATKQSPHLIGAFNGVDHIWIQADLPAIIEKLKILYPNYTFAQANMSEYVQASLQDLPKNLPTYSGSLQGVLCELELHGTWSARQDVKWADHLSLALLSRAEQAFALARPHHPYLIREPLNRAWDWLFHNHAHDSICGCSPDPTYQDQMNRYQHIQQVCTDIIEDSLHTLVKKQLGDQPRALALLPPDRGSFLGITELFWDSSEPISPDFKIGKKQLPQQNLNVSSVKLRSAVMGASSPYGFSLHQDTIYRHHLILDTSGLDTFAIAYPHDHSLKKSKKRIAIKPLLAIKKVKTYLQNLEIIGDTGGLYGHCPSGNSVRWRYQEDAIQIKEEGLLRWSYQWKLYYKPLNLKNHKKIPATLVRDIDVQLFAKHPIALIQETWTGHVRDARIRLVLPTPKPGFKIRRDIMDEVLIESDSQLQSTPAKQDWDRAFFFQNWLQVLQQGKCQLTFWGNGLHEFGLSSKGKNIGITIFRPQGFVKQCGDWPTPKAQLVNPHTFRYALGWGSFTPKICAQFAEELALPTIAEPAPDFEIYPNFPHATTASSIQNVECSDRELGWRPMQNFRSGWRINR